MTFWPMKIGFTKFNLNLVVFGNNYSIYTKHVSVFIKKMLNACYC